MWVHTLDRHQFLVIGGFRHADHNPKNHLSAKTRVRATRLFKGPAAGPRHRRRRRRRARGLHIPFFLKVPGHPRLKPHPIFFEGSWAPSFETIFWLLITPDHTRAVVDRATQKMRFFNIN